MTKDVDKDIDTALSGFIMTVGSGVVGAFTSAAGAGIGYFLTRSPAGAAAGATIAAIGTSGVMANGLKDMWKGTDSFGKCLLGIVAAAPAIPGALVALSVVPK